MIPIQNQLVFLEPSKTNPQPFTTSDVIAEYTKNSYRSIQRKVDVIADDKKLIEIYIAVVKEMAVKYGVSVDAAPENKEENNVLSA